MSLPQPSNTSSMNFARLADASDLALSAAVGSEINRLNNEAATLGKLRATVFGVA
jgi:hypothetical protein